MMTVQSGFFALLAAVPLALAQNSASAAALTFKVEGSPAASSGAAAISMVAQSPAAASPSAQAMTISMVVAGGAGNLSGAASPTAAGSLAGSQPSAAPAAGSQNVWVMNVGSANGSLTFSPESISGAKAGDMIQFQFYPRNHSVVLGDYNNACAPSPNSPSPFFSGFMPTNANGQLTYTVSVKDTNPMWLYCSQGRHCQEGMVGVVNPPTSGQTLADYKARAARAANNITPQSPPGSGSGSGGTPIVTGVTPSGPTTSPARASTSDASIVFRSSSWGLAVLAAVVFLTL